MKPYKILLLPIMIAAFSNCTKDNSKYFDQGVSKDLAKLREKQLSEINYNLFFTIPDSVNKEIEGRISLEFNFTNYEREPLIIDFQNSSDKVKSVNLNNKPVKFRYVNQHIVIPYRKIKKGRNTIEIEFIATDRALNRNPEYLYTLFVPDRASTAFPCFDQPSLKATYKLELKTPNQWVAVSNGEMIQKQEFANYNIYSFKETEPISTYLFSFAAGIFKSVTQTQQGKTVTMFHRESDSLKVLRNQQKIFDLHFSSIKWLENYTKIPYPFQKFDFVVIPSFQYSGMEHPGAILYRDSKLFLDESAGIRDELTRANLIAHETAHIWFGDLVTMRWFSQVWLKEVFANFIADKIVNPQYPEVNHDLNFLLNHYPDAYSVDRTTGANPIDQQLDNMKDAGTLYGSIIYHKAPIVMKHLEDITGEDLLQKGLQEYLTTYTFGNASWDDLISILEKNTSFDLTRWNNEWVKRAGMPELRIEKSYNTNNELASLVIEQSDLFDKRKCWSQNIEILIRQKEKTEKISTFLNDTFTVAFINEGMKEPELILPNVNGLAYGYFALDEPSASWLLSNLDSFNDPVMRCSIYITLWENMLNRNILPDALLNTLMGSLQKESEEQNINLILNYITTLYWKFISLEYRNKISIELEEYLWNRIKNEKSPKLKNTFFKSYINISSTPGSIENLYKFWNNELTIQDLKFSENDFTELAYELALRMSNLSDSILAKQLDRIKDTERKEKMKFIIPALSNNISERDKFFESLKAEKNREKEVWVVSALYYLHHPLRSKESIKYIRPSLELLQEIQITGDIFFPKQWLDATFSGYSSIGAVIEVNMFLNANENYPENLRNKILQSSDLLFRASQIKQQ